jgi:hypothetical protein
MIENLNSSIFLIPLNRAKDHIFQLSLPLTTKKSGRQCVFKPELFHKGLPQGITNQFYKSLKKWRLFTLQPESGRGLKSTINAKALLLD